MEGIELILNVRNRDGKKETKLRDLVKVESATL